MDALAKTYRPGDYVHIITDPAYAQWEVVTLRHGGDCILATVLCRIVNHERFDTPTKGDMREVDTSQLEDCDH